VFDKWSKSVNEEIDKMLKRDYTTAAKEEGTSPLDIESMTKIFNRFKRDNGHCLITECNYIPDKCYGIIFLRPEDAKIIKNK